MTSFLAAVLLLLPQAVVIRDSVQDDAGVMRPADAAALRTLLADVERTDSTQVVLLTVRTTGGRPIEEFALETARANGIGQKGKNNGVLVVVAVDDRRCRIEVGYGLEGRLTDALSGRIIRNEMVPRFKDGDTSGGARAGVEAVVKAVRGQYAKETDNRAYKGPPFTWKFDSGDRSSNVPIAWGIGVFIVALVLRFMKRHGTAFALVPPWTLLIWWLASVSWPTAIGTAFVGTIFGLFAEGSRGGRGHSFGSGSGGGGGWSGGGGSFGGGGASGRW